MALISRKFAEAELPDHAAQRSRQGSTTAAGPGLIGAAASMMAR
jgi:hypothetical protein